MNESRCSNTKRWNCEKFGHKRLDCPEREKAQQAIDSALKSSVSNEELDFRLCTMHNVSVEKLYEESISLANEVPAEMQDKHPVKQVQYVDEVEKVKKKLIMGDNSKSRMCKIDGQSFYPFASRTWIGDSGVSCFTTNDPTGIRDAEPMNESIEAANWLMKATIKGKKDVIIKKVDGRTTCYTLEPVKYRKQAKENLFSLTSVMSKGRVLGSDDQNNIVINQEV